eukprot:862689-Pleurochrysis_carterae.AAC.3
MSMSTSSSLRPSRLVPVSHGLYGQRTRTPRAEHCINASIPQPQVVKIAIDCIQMCMWIVKKEVVRVHLWLDVRGLSPFKLIKHAARKI